MNTIEEINTAITEWDGQPDTRTLEVPVKKVFLADRISVLIGRVNRQWQLAVDALKQELVQVYAQRDEAYTTIQVEAALCVWEDLLARHHAKQERDICLLGYWDDHGTVHVRHDAMKIGNWIDEVYNRMDADVRDGFAYDWEIVPFLVDLIEWHSGHPYMPPVEEAVLKAEVYFRQIGVRS